MAQDARSACKSSLLPTWSLSWYFDWLRSLRHVSPVHISALPCFPNIHVWAIKVGAEFNFNKRKNPVAGFLHFPGHRPSLTLLAPFGDNRLISVVVWASALPPSKGLWTRHRAVSPIAHFDISRRRPDYNVLCFPNTFLDIIKWSRLPTLFRFQMKTRLLSCFEIVWPLITFYREWQQFSPALHCDYQLQYSCCTL